VTSVTAKT